MLKNSNGTPPPWWHTRSPTPFAASRRALYPGMRFVHQPKMYSSYAAVQQLCSSYAAVQQLCSCIAAAVPQLCQQLCSSKQLFCNSRAVQQPCCATAVLCSLCSSCAAAVPQICVNQMPREFISHPVMKQVNGRELRKSWFHDFMFDLE